MNETNYIEENEILIKLGKWEDVYSLPTRMTLESFWYTMEKWSLNPQCMNKSAKKFSLTNKSTYDKNNQQLSNYIFKKNLSGIFLNENEEKEKENYEKEEKEKEKEDENDENENKLKKQKHKHHGCENDEDEDENENIFKQDGSIEKDINTKDINESELAIEYLDDKVETIIYKRHLIPRLLNRDPSIDELVYHRKSSNQCQFIPMLNVIDNARLLPFFYPKVLGFNIIYQQLDSIKDKDLINQLLEKEINDEIEKQKKQKQKQKKNKSNPNKEKKKEEQQEEEIINFKGILKIQVIYFKEFQPKFDKTSKQILEKLNRWGVNYEIGYKKKANLDQIVPKNVFLSMYEEMKQRYKTMEEGWKEVTQTDPQKFIYEDVAIAAYLICIWRKENQENGKSPNKPTQRFIDIGCGNGLLVHILNKEGYDGIGIDLRSRKIWAKYDDQVQKNLIEEAILPKDTTFEQYDWIIGNHSDELTPWVPYITSKLPNQRFFLLPCCFYNFNSRFKENDTRIGKYSCYLNYIEKVSNECGFNVIKETLRIPSTKNIAFISSLRDPTLTDDQLIERRQKLLKSSNYIDFKPRERDIKWVPQKKYQPGQYNPHLDPLNPNNIKRIIRKENKDKENKDKENKDKENKQEEV
ncbi:hypothetical protein DDB_G0269348 [Dictyostelium discoideum AX4]|uniref:tRNA (uracil-O(2)-)-methyltransferase n=1 Tax=Dictyostelium discoideum TaxID=44689 RepID=Q55E88_DICDI|nr:hypothetical protein DDB_G0269348 [Dictyostelium discoideum AX4]EAL72024.1 hypothetical protein DDB_G0269348 [Dictyostelium discoideum AX4]|eukprot:XP_645893.1 hypothetical protein DDB_G0269348 [Dictyostelium discoideum AX4]